MIWTHSSQAASFKFETARQPIKWGEENDSNRTAHNTQTILTKHSNVPAARTAIAAACLIGAVFAAPTAWAATVTNSGTPGTAGTNGTSGSPNGTAGGSGGNATSNSTGSDSNNTANSYGGAGGSGGNGYSAGGNAGAGGDGGSATSSAVAAPVGPATASAYADGGVGGVAAVRAMRRATGALARPAPPGPPAVAGWWSTPLSLVAGVATVPAGLLAVPAPPRRLPMAYRVRPAARCICNRPLMGVVAARRTAVRRAVRAAQIPT